MVSVHCATIELYMHLGGLLSTQEATLGYRLVRLLRYYLANEDTLLLMMFLGLRKLGNTCCGHKMFLNKIRNIFCVPDTKFVSATNGARGQTGKHLCRQQCVLVCQGLYAAFVLSNLPRAYIILRKLQKFSRAHWLIFNVNMRTDTWI